ncbi:MAG: AAA family ATPase, partial [Candidatus Shapirobacteria bacterium]
SRHKPYGSFLFLGPTGVGKTQTAKVLAGAYFGAEERLIRFDMSEYQGEIGFTKALGDPNTQEPGLLVKAIRDNPFSVLLLDEIEKTDPKILNLLLPLLDEGYLTDNFGHKLDARHLIIIGTSNAGSEMIRQKIAQKVKFSDLSSQVLNYIQKERIFSPELLNRFDGVIVYLPLTQNELKQVTRLMLSELNARLIDKEISVKITDKLIDQIVELGNQPEFGARALRRVIQDRVETRLAQKMLDASLTRGEVVEINLDKSF